MNNNKTANKKSKIPPLKELRKICQTPESALHDSWYGRNFARRISIYFTKFFLHLHLSGNQVTALWCILEITAGILFCFGNYWFSVIGALLIQLAYILDGTDGEVSRYRKTSSLKGEYFDRLCHNISYPCIFIGISFGVYTNFHTIWAFVFGFSASMFFLLMWLVELERDKIVSKSKKDVEMENTAATFTKQTTGGNSLLKVIGNKIIDPTSIDVILWIVLTGAILNFMYLILILYGVLLPCRWLLQVYYNLKYKF